MTRPGQAARNVKNKLYLESGERKGKKIRLDTDTGEMAGEFTLMTENQTSTSGRAENIQSSAMKNQGRQKPAATTHQQKIRQILKAPGKGYTRREQRHEGRAIIYSLTNPAI